MNILGIGGYSHDSAACLVQDGTVVSAAMEERFTRKKHEGGIPHKAIEYCLQAGGIGRDDVAHITAYMNPFYRLRKRLPYRIRTMLKSPRYGAAYALYELLHNAGYMRGTLGLRGRGTKVHWLDHHTAHAASAFFCSPFEEAATLSLDYIGEWASTHAAHARGSRIDLLFEQNFPQSLGVIYSAITDYLGFIRANDEYKVMGLASYGDPARYRGVFNDIVHLESEGRYRVDLDYFQYHYLPGSRLGYVSRKFLDACGPKRDRDGPLEQRHKDVAAALQECLEQTVFHILRHLYMICPAGDRLCLAGGVALNSVLNGRIPEETPYQHLYIQPAAGDDGIAIGGALWCYHHILGNPRESKTPMPHAYLGPEFSSEEIEAMLQREGVTYTRLDDPSGRAAELIAEGRIVGWFSGRMEFGPRALGARSILADPTRLDMQDIVNNRVKHREDFRPFAPAVPEEEAARIFQLPGTLEDCIPLRYMLMVVPVQEAYRERLPAITHVDGSARVQTVRESDHPRYYRVMREFEKLRGLPVVLNTSFNVKGEPIVCTPLDALRCFQGTGIDDLILEEFHVT